MRGLYSPCGEDFMTTYLNRADVRTALHVDHTRRWQPCDDAVFAGYDEHSHDAPMQPVWEHITRSVDWGALQMPPLKVWHLATHTYTSAGLTQLWPHSPLCMCALSTVHVCGYIACVHSSSHYAACALRVIHAHHDIHACHTCVHAHVVICTGAHLQRRQRCHLWRPWHPAVGLQPGLGRQHDMGAMVLCRYVLPQILSPLTVPPSPLSVSPPPHTPSHPHPHRHTFHSRSRVRPPARRLLLYLAGAPLRDCAWSRPRGARLQASGRIRPLQSIPQPLDHGRRSALLATAIAASRALNNYTRPAWAALRRPYPCY